MGAPRDEDLYPVTRSIRRPPEVRRAEAPTQPAIVQQAMRRAEKEGAEMLLVRSGADLCVVWGRQLGGKRPVWWSRHVVAESAGHARRAEEMFQRYEFNVATNPGDRLAAVLLYAGAAKGAAEIRVREVHRLRKRGSGKREPW